MPPDVFTKLLAWELLLPKTSPSNSVVVCPEALALESLVSSCASSVVLSSDEPSANGFTLTTLEDPTFWHVRADAAGTFGAFEYAPPRPPSVAVVSASQNDRHVSILYSVTDAESNPVSILPEYSITGEWNGEQKPMTLLPDGVELGQAISDFQTSPEGVERTFVWDIGTDIGAEIGSAYVRVTPTDSSGSGEPVVYGPISFSAFNPPATLIERGSPALTESVSKTVTTRSSAEVVLPPTPVAVSVGQEAVATSSSPVVSTPPVTPLFTKETKLPDAPTLQLVRQVENAKVSPILKAPEIAEVAQVSPDDDVTFSGKGIPNSKVALFVYSEQLVFYVTKVQQDGTWSIVHEQHEVALAAGAHTAYAMTYDPYSAVRSQPTKAFTFSVEFSRISQLLSYVDLKLTVVTLAFSVIVFTILTKYRRIRIVRRSARP